MAVSSVGGDQVEDLRHYTKRDVMARACLGKRSIERHAADPACPLRFVRRKAGTHVVCTPDVLRAYLEWLKLDGAAESPRAVG